MKHENEAKFKDSQTAGTFKAVFLELQLSN
jgi:hypothetical protein